MAVLCHDPLLQKYISFPLLFVYLSWLVCVFLFIYLFTDFFFFVLQSRNVLSGGNVGRSAFLNEALSRAPHYSTDLGQLDGGLGFLRGYLTSIGASRGLVGKSYLSDLNFVLANPRIRRFLSSEAPKKKSKKFIGLCFNLVDMLIIWMFDNVWYMVCNSIADYENFYPKNKKETPKGEEQKSESKGEFLI